jgi:hypothetical protein
MGRRSPYSPRNAEPDWAGPTPYHRDGYNDFDYHHDDDRNLGQHLIAADGEVKAIFTDTSDLSAEDQRRAWRELTLAIEAMNGRQAQAEATQINEADGGRPTRLAARWRGWMSWRRAGSSGSLPVLNSRRD